MAPRIITNVKKENGTTTLIIGRKIVIETDFDGCGIERGNSVQTMDTETGLLIHGMVCINCSYRKRPDEEGGCPINFIPVNRK